MLTPRQNLNEVMKGIENGGRPDHFSNNWEAFEVVLHPVMANWGGPKPGEENVVNSWGITSSWAPGQPGAFPVHTPDKIVIQDMEEWQDYVHAPKAKYSDAEWEPFQEAAEKIDRNEKYVLPVIAPGIWEQCHNLYEISQAMMALYEYPDELHDLIKYLTDWELQVSEDIIDHLHPDGVFHHDDWGTQNSLMMKNEMFEEFLLEPYKELYGYWRSRGCDMIVHHSDSFGEPLVPYMIDMGIKVWQGVMDTNDINMLIDKYGDKITFMGGINSAHVDYEGATYEVVEKVVREVCNKYGPSHMIYCTTQGMAITTFPEVYDWVTQAIDKVSKEYWAEHSLPAGEVTVTE